MYRLPPEGSEWARGPVVGVQPEGLSGRGGAVVDAQPATPALYVEVEVSHTPNLQVQVTGPSSPRKNGRLEGDNARCVVPRTPLT